jgi:hypothetical protein
MDAHFPVLGQVTGKLVRKERAKDGRTKITIDTPRFGSLIIMLNMAETKIVETPLPAEKSAA